MALNITGIDKDPDLAPPSRENLLKAAEACSSPAATKSLLLLKLDALRSVMPVKKARWLDFLPFKLLDTIREDAERLIVDVNAQDQFWTSAGDILIDVVNKHPEIGKTVHDVIAAGGDIEIAAHNESARITITSVKLSGQRKILFDSRNHAMNGCRLGGVGIAPRLQARYDSRENPNDAHMAKVLTEDEARRVASNIAKLPEDQSS
jgi:hypothetical protein